MNNEILQCKQNTKLNSEQNKTLTHSQSTHKKYSKADKYTNTSLFSTLLFSFHYVFFSLLETWSYLEPMKSLQRCCLCG